MRKNLIVPGRAAAQEMVMHLRYNSNGTRVQGDSTHSPRG